MVFDAVGLHQGKLLSMEAFKRAIGERAPAHPAAGDMDAAGNPFLLLERLPTLVESRRLLVEEALRRAEGNQSIAARLLGITQSALSRRLKAAREERS